jgi:hypothetical protein
MVAAIVHHWPAAYTTGQEPVLVEVRGEETLRIWFTVRPDGGFADVCLETGARAIYTGILRLELVHELRCRLQAL